MIGKTISKKILCKNETVKIMSKCRMRTKKPPERNEHLVETKQN